MDRTVRDHIASLEERVQNLTVELMNARNRSDLNKLETEIRVAKLALERYREALSLESSLQEP